MAMGGTKVGLASALAIAVGLGAPAWSQDRGGITLQFDVSQRLELQLPSGGDTITQALTGLGFIYTTETRTDRLSFSTGFDLRAIDGPSTAGFETDILNPRVTLAYSRTGAAATLSANASYSENDISFLRPLTDFVDSDGNVTLPEDFDDLTGSGSREQLSYSARLTLRDNRPFGLSFSLAGSSITYRDTTDPDLIDSDRLELGLGFRFDINPAVTANLDITHSRFQSAGSAETASNAVVGAVAFAQPTGSLTFGLSASETGGGIRWGLSLARELELSEIDAFTAELGVTFTAGGETVATGGLSFRRELAQGAVSARLNRSVTTTIDDEEQVLTSFSGSYSTALSEDIGLAISASYARASETAIDVQTDVADLGVELSYDLTRDWALSAGVSRQWRTEDPGASTSTDIISVGLARSFQWRY